MANVRGEIVSMVRPSEADESRWGGRLVTLVAIALFIGLPIYFASRGEGSEWFDCYYTAASHLIAGEPLYHKAESYVYPPAMALLAAPLCYFGLQGSLAIWGAINAAAICLLVMCVGRWCNGSRWLVLDRSNLGVGLIASLLAFRWFIAPLSHQQFDLVIAALILGGGLLLLRGRDVWSGTLIGAAAAMKCTPLLFAPYFVWRGRWRAALMVVVMSWGLNVLPDLCFPNQAGTTYLSQWKDKYLLGMSGKAPGTWYSDVTLNQSIGGAVQRFMRFGLPTALDGPRHEITQQEAVWMKLVVYGFDLTLLALAAWITRPGRRPEQVERAECRESTERRWAWEFSAVVCLMLLLSPMSSKAHYVVLMLPCWLIAKLVWQQPTAPRWGIVALLLITGPLASKDLLGKSLADLTLVWGFPTAFALILLGTSLWQLSERVPQRANNSQRVPLRRAA